MEGHKPVIAVQVVRASYTIKIKKQRLKVRVWNVTFKALAGDPISKDSRSFTNSPQARDLTFKVEAYRGHFIFKYSINSPLKLL